VKIGVGFLSAAEIEAVVDGLRKEYDLYEIPIDVEKVVEYDFDMHVAPSDDIEIDSDSAGWISSDLSTLYIDSDVYHNDRYTNFRRFTYAHEIGHIVLHQKYLCKLKYSTIEEWKKVRLSIDPTEIEWMETQSRMFAGMLLVPNPELEISFKRELDNITKDIDEAKSMGISKDKYDEWALGKIVRVLAKEFIVSSQCMTIRCVKAGIVKLIP